MGIIETVATEFVKEAAGHIGKQCVEHHKEDIKKVIDDGWKRDYEAGGITKATEDKRSTGLNPA